MNGYTKLLRELAGEERFHRFEARSHRATVRARACELRAALACPFRGAEPTPESVWHYATQVRFYREMARESTRRLLRVRAEIRAVKAQRRDLRTMDRILRRGVGRAAAAAGEGSR